MSSNVPSEPVAASSSPAQSVALPEACYIYHVHGVSIESIRRSGWPPTAEDSSLSQFSTSDHLLVYGLRPPDEVFKFGLRSHDILDIRLAPKDQIPASPESLGITKTAEDGVCKYCQLMLLPNVPDLTEHHTNIQLLIDSCETCSICNALTLSLFRGVPWLPEVLSQSSSRDDWRLGRPISIILTKYATYTKVVGCVGDRDLYTNHGRPLTITTASRLGELATRRFWTAHHETDHAQPHERIGMLKSWLNDCESHEICNSLLPATFKSRLPTRVIDLTWSPDLPIDADDIVIRLQEVEEGEVGTYTALSHCWGADSTSHFTTEIGTLDARKGKIDFGSLPLTYREAILVTLYLGIRYLWIDSVCIIQDSREDWEIESAKMGNVYANAHLTLAATQSKTPQEGLLNPFEKARSCNGVGEDVIVRMETHMSVDGSSDPLNTRGWTLQEAVLSSRIISFGTEQWLWKCPSRHATEDGLVDGPASSIDGVTQWVNLAKQGASGDKKLYLTHWHMMIMNYAKRHLSHRSDKAAAIAGLVSMFVKATGYRYFAGLWMEDLANGLLWEADSRGVTRDPGSIPSWSWLSTHGRIRGYTFNENRSLVELLDVEEQWEGTPLVSLLKVARLSIKAPMFSVRLGKRSVTELSRHTVVDIADNTETLGEAFLDTQLADDSGVLTILCLLIRDEEKHNQWSALLVIPDANERKTDDTNIFRRIGTAVLWKISKFLDDKRDGNEIRAKAIQSPVVLV